MKKIIKIIFVLGLLMPVSVQAQSVTWQKYYNYESGHDYAQDAIQTFDGGYLTVGYGRSSSVFIGAFLLKLDYLGNVQWKKFLGIPSENRMAYKVSQISDSGYIIVGESFNTFLIFKTNEKGEVIWDKRYSIDNSDASRGYSFAMTADNYIISCGIVYFYSILEAYPFIVKTDMSGNLKWKKYFKDMTNITSFDIIAIENNEYIFCGSQYLRKIDSSGNVISTNSYWSGSGFLSLRGLEYEKPNIIYCGGISELNGIGAFHLLKVNTNDSLYWSNRIENSENIYASGRSICLQKESIYMTGTYNLKGVVPFVKVSTEGETQLYNLIPESQAVESYAISINPAEDNGFIICGSTRFGIKPFPSYKYLIIKSDSNGYAPELVNVKNNTVNTELYVLYQNYPNPFNPVTTIEYHLQKQAFVTLTFFDVSGKRINEFANGLQYSGNYSFKFDGTNLPSGIYFYQLKIIEDGISKTIGIKKMFLIK